ncbi:MAG: HAD family hydrolase [Clostridia bacterium]|nr:HAD family hydrolase [Clostridia bacterium]
MNRYRAVIFDLDGTLLDTLDDLADAVNYALATHGYPTRTRDEVRLFVGNGVRLLMIRALPGGEENPQFEEVLATFRTYYAAHSQCKTAPYPGILSLLAKLQKNGVRVAVVSNKFDAAVRDLCAHYFGSLVEVAVGESPEVPKKPAPDTVLRAMRLLGVSPDESVYVGDSDVDVETAKNSGIPCISVLWGFRDRAFLEAHGATRFAADVDALAVLL